MGRHSVVLLIATLTAFSIPSGAHAQQDELHAPSGNTRMTVQSIFVPPLPNAPFTATVITTWQRKIEDGSTVTIQNHRTIARDSSGRIFQERRNLYPAGDSRENDIRQIEISDPASHEMYQCRRQARVCELTVYYGRVQSAPLLPTGPIHDGKAFLTRESLGNDSVDGVEAVGTRETTTLNAGTIGNNKNISIVKEFWYSPQLGINVIEKRQDPRVGTQSFRVSNISLTEPDSSLFQLPEGYRVIDNRNPQPLPPAAN